MTRGRYRWALAVVAVSAFMTTMDNTVVFTALPTIMADLDMSSSAKDWVATGYILMFSCLMIMGGRLADVYGCRVTFTSGMVVFTAASAVCGLAQTSDVLILARIVQGAGAALVLPATQVMVTVGRTDKQRSIGNIAFIGAASSATALGPTIGGVIVQHWHWGWIFLINILPGILVIVLGLFVLTSHGENKHARIDLPGVLISATMLFAFIYGLESGNKYGWANPSVLSVFALGAIALVCFILVESWAPDPMIDLRFFRNRVFTGGLMSQMLYGIGFNGMMFYSQPFLQRFLGFSPPEAGLVMLPPAIAIMVLTPVAFLLAAKIGPRPAIGAGMVLMGLGMFLFSTLQTGDGYADLMPGVMLVGIGAALGMPLVMYVLKAVPERRAGVASGVINVIREASGAFGIAIIGLLIYTVPDEGASATELETFRDGTSSGLILGAGLVLIGGVISALTLPSRRGWLGPKHGKKPPVIPEPGPGPGPRETTPDPIPVAPLGAPVDLALVSASPPNAPVPLPTTWEDEAMPDDRAPTPGPHWWTDTETKPTDDTFTWQKDTGPPTPWPAPPAEPPPAPPNAWEDWPTTTSTTSPSESAQRNTVPIPVVPPPRATGTWKDTPEQPSDDDLPPPLTAHGPSETTTNRRPEDARGPTTENIGDEGLTTPHPSRPSIGEAPSSPHGTDPSVDSGRPNPSARTEEAKAPLTEPADTVDAEKPGKRYLDQTTEAPFGAGRIASPHTGTHTAEVSPSQNGEGTTEQRSEQGAPLTSSESLPLPRRTSESPAPELLRIEPVPPADSHPEPLKAASAAHPSEDIEPLLHPTTTEDTAALPGRSQTGPPAGRTWEPAQDVGAQAGTAEDTGAGVSDHQGESVAGGGERPGDGVRSLRVTARAASVGDAGALVGEPSGQGVGSADEVVGGDGADGPSAEDGGRPAPPEGWYEPYVPEESPVDEPQPTPRSDAW
ncbi:DHA2 family efflux MFS transporter permease subunit [Actinomadura sp. 3N407]|uniref:MFS transporter n=1 Tax=Actinomadura sp. 3N407 TaxID=3457423 RepID=UPI003FCC869E